MFVTERIGNEYKEWKNGEIIMITAPTGSGKSYFIFHTLLDWAAEQNKKILYLVNRKILKKQLEQERDLVSLKKSYMESRKMARDYILIETYQWIESKIKDIDIEEVLRTRKFIESYDYVVYDECHYFYADSNFNTNTELSYEYLRGAFRGKIQIFISATMDNMSEVIKNYKYIYWEAVFEHNWQNVAHTKPIFRKYGLDMDYNYINLHAFQELEDLREQIIETAKKGQKWLIFIDSKEKGKSFKQRLTASKKEKNSLAKEDVVFIDANFRKDNLAEESVEELKEDKIISKKVIIATAVIDNGISFYDDSLRNLVILADSKEEFIQMLGRKRQDNEGVEVFVCKQNITYFQNRRQRVDKILKTYDYYANHINDRYKRFALELENRLKFSYQENPEQFEKIRQLTSTADAYSYYRIELYLHQKIQETGWNPNGYFQTWLFYIRNTKNNYDSRFVRDLLENMLHQEGFVERINKFAYYLQGNLAINRFSIQRLMDLRSFYVKMIDDLKKDSEAFLKKQVEWLGYSQEEVPAIISKANTSYEDVFKSQITETLELLKEKELSREENIEKIKKGLCKPLLYFYQKKAETSQIADFKKLDRPVTQDVFNECMKIANLPYRMSKPDKQTFYIKKVS